jgi:hypothetical protein
MTSEEKFEAALKWVEDELGGLCGVSRIDKTNAEIDNYLVGLGDGWSVWALGGDGDWTLLNDSMDPVEAVACAIGYAMPEVLVGSFPEDEES